MLTGQLAPQYFSKMKKEEISVANVIAVATSKGKDVRAALYEDFGSWLPEKGNTPETLKGWCGERMKLYQKWMENLKVLAKDCSIQSASNLSDEELQAILDARKAQN